MKRSLFIALVAAVSLLTSIAGRSLSREGPPGESSGGLLYGELRVVSMAPSITEVLYELGLGDNVTGVTRYCDYPPDAAKKPRVGGYLDPNYEAILSQSPDLVVLLAEQAARRPFFEEIGIRTMLVDHSTVGGILNSIVEIGRACSVADSAEALAEHLRARIEAVRERSRGLHRPRVLVTVGRNLSGDTTGDMFICGRDGYYDQLIELAGGVNAYAERTAALPSVSAEGLRELDPEVIVEMVPDLAASGDDPEEFRSSWARIARGVRAVEQGRVHVFGESFAVRPGPRFILLLELMARAIHPELEWSA